MEPEQPVDARIRRLPIGPGRAGFSKGTRTRVGLALGAVVVVAAIVGALTLGDKSPAPIRSVTIPAADRSASPALLRVAEAIGFEPTHEQGAGTVEAGPIPARLPNSAANLLLPGTPAPAFRLRTPTGTTVSLASFRGKAVLLEFFATWCPHCAAEAPHLKAMADALPHSRYAFAAVNADGETAPSVLAFHIYFGLPFPALLDPSSHPGSFHHEGSAGPVTKAYDVAEYPTFYVLDPQGYVSWAGQGEQPDALLERELRDAARR